MRHQVSKTPGPRLISYYSAFWGTIPILDAYLPSPATTLEVLIACLLRPDDVCQKVVSTATNTLSRAAGMRLGIWAKLIMGIGSIQSPPCSIHRWCACLQQFTTKNNHISVFALCHHADDMLDSSNKGTCSVSRAFLNLSASHLQVINPEGLEKAASAARVKPPFCEVFVCGSRLFEYAWIFRVGPLNACQGGQEIPHWHKPKVSI